mmetsp:Transcript_6337/g.9759  ORF Transcript_6337/g.9759 Transcript_6337/m.9759 type:complete len:214 (+) Transcript_6337:87-728(+)|eukprot:CAMPEP_0178925652 /NCGR_PEP_ID=MMETSP0786-20121207/18043_1 /TAXON_ID=186022 /ORGANISM="Thalassionema frauenfeldii, Strain CCMP 1798" /LENGTH=213 /DNA_ID=CAMNT_0020600581 /DNA_START=74 /DNA_END=715 /DNA_ORIENTATION=+
MTVEPVPYYPNPKPKRNPGFLAPRESGELHHLRQENRLLHRELVRAHERIRELEEQQRDDISSRIYEDDDDNFSVEVVQSTAPSERTSTCSSVISTAPTVAMANTSTAITKNSKKRANRRRKRRNNSAGSMTSSAMERITEITRSFSGMSTTSELTNSTNLSLSSSASMNSSVLSDSGLTESSVYAIRSLLQSSTDDSVEDEQSNESSLFGEI